MLLNPSTNVGEEQYYAFTEQGPPPASQRYSSRPLGIGKPIAGPTIRPVRPASAGPRTFKGDAEEPALPRGAWGDTRSVPADESGEAPKFRGPFRAVEEARKAREAVEEFDIETPKSVSPEPPEAQPSVQMAVAKPESSYEDAKVEAAEAALAAAEAREAAAAEAAAVAAAAAEAAAADEAIAAAAAAEAAAVVKLQSFARGHAVRQNNAVASAAAAVATEAAEADAAVAAAAVAEAELALAVAAAEEEAAIAAALAAKQAAADAEAVAEAAEAEAVRLQTKVHSHVARQRVATEGSVSQETEQEVAAVKLQSRARGYAARKKAKAAAEALAAAEVAEAEAQAEWVQVAEEIAKQVLETGEPGTDSELQAVKLQSFARGRAARKKVAAAKAATALASAEAEVAAEEVEEAELVEAELPTVTEVAEEPEAAEEPEVAEEESRYGCKIVLDEDTKMFRVRIADLRDLNSHSAEAIQPETPEECNGAEEHQDTEPAPLSFSCKIEKSGDRYVVDLYDSEMPSSSQSAEAVETEIAEEKRHKYDVKIFENETGDFTVRLIDNEEIAMPSSQHARKVVDDAVDMAFETVAAEVAESAVSSSEELEETTAEEAAAVKLQSRARGNAARKEAKAAARSQERPITQAEAADSDAKTHCIKIALTEAAEYCVKWGVQKAMEGLTADAGAVADTVPESAAFQLQGHDRDHHAARQPAEEREQELAASKLDLALEAEPVFASPATQAAGSQAEVASPTSSAPGLYQLQLCYEGDQPVLKVAPGASSGPKAIVDVQIPPTPAPAAASASEPAMEAEVEVAAGVEAEAEAAVAVPTAAEVQAAAPVAVAVEAEAATLPAEPEVGGAAGAMPASISEGYTLKLTRAGSDTYSVSLHKERLARLRIDSSGDLEQPARVTIS